MTDPFLEATKTLFRSQLAKDATYTDRNTNILSVRVVEKTQVELFGNGFQAQVIGRAKAFDINESGVKTGETLTIGDKTYAINEIIKDDGYSTSVIAE